MEKISVSQFNNDVKQMNCRREVSGKSVLNYLHDTYCIDFQKPVTILKFTDAFTLNSLNMSSEVFNTELIENPLKVLISYNPDGSSIYTIVDTPIQELHKYSKYSGNVTKYPIGYKQTITFSAEKKLFEKIRKSDTIVKYLIIVNRDNLLSETKENKAFTWEQEIYRLNTRLNLKHFKPSIGTYKIYNAHTMCGQTHPLNRVTPGALFSMCDAIKYEPFVMEYKNSDSNSLYPEYDKSGYSRASKILILNDMMYDLKGKRFKGKLSNIDFDKLLAEVEEAYYQKRNEIVENYISVNSLEHVKVGTKALRMLTNLYELYASNNRKLKEIQESDNNTHPYSLYSQCELKALRDRQEEITSFNPDLIEL